jgi:hypothetical protein
MRNLQRRLKKLEIRRRLKREQRIVTRCEGLDGEFEVWESRPEEEGDETITIMLVYEDSPPLDARHRRLLASDIGK